MRFYLLTMLATLLTVAAALPQPDVVERVRAVNERLSTGLLSLTKLTAGDYHHTCLCNGETRRTSAADM